MCGFLDADSTALTFYPAKSADEVTYTLKVNSTYSRVESKCRPELAQGAEVSAAVATYCQKPGTGLEAQSPVLVWAIVGPSGKEVETGETPLPVSDNAKFESIALVRGRIIAVFQDGDGKYKRLGISSNNVSWTLSMDKSGYDGVLDCNVILPGIGNTLLVPINASRTMVSIDQDSGRVLKTLQVLMYQNASVLDQTRDYFTANTSLTTDDIWARGHGPSLFSKKDGSRFNRYDCNSIIIDHTSHRAILTYPITDGGSTRDPLPNPKAPGMEVVDLDSGKILFTLPRDKSSAIGGVEVLAALDNHLTLSSPEGMKLVLADSAKNDPSDPLLPAKTFRLSNVIVGSGAYWALLGSTNGFGEWPDQMSSTGIVRKNAPLVWTDIPRVQPVST